MAKPNMVEQNTFHPAHATRPKQDTNVSATTGIGYKTIELGIQCEICETIFLNKTKFENHVISGQCKWVCKLCKKTFEYSIKKASIKSHHYSLFKKKLEQHKKECDRTCKLCGYSSEERCKLVRHMKFRHSNTKRYACDICFITFKSETILYTHKINKHTDKAGLYRCPQCPKEYMLLSSLSAHLKYSHLGPKRNEVPCSVCGKMLDIYSVKRHEASHKINNLKCDICLAVFNHVSTLREHKRRHNKDYSHCCESCGKGFYTISKLTDHRRIHTGEKPFSCSLCQYRCNIKVNLDKHMKIHGKPSNQR